MFSINYDHQLCVMGVCCHKSFGLLITHNRVVEHMSNSEILCSVAVGVILNYVTTTISST